jgi:hypothetical protein
LQPAADAARCRNASKADMKGMTDQQLKNCLGALVVDFKRNQANGHDTNTQAGLPNRPLPGPVPNPSQPEADAARCRNASKADMKGMTDQQLKNCVGTLVGDFKRSQANGQKTNAQGATAQGANSQGAGPTTIKANVVD